MRCVLHPSPFCYRPCKVRDFGILMLADIGPFSTIVWIVIVYGQHSIAVGVAATVSYSVGLGITVGILVGTVSRRECFSHYRYRAGCVTYL